MIRRDGRTTDEDSPLGANNDVPDLWRINPWLAAHMIGPAHSQCIDPVAQERGHAMFAALRERSAATPVDTDQEELKKEG